MFGGHLHLDRSMRFGIFFIETRKRIIGEFGQDIGNTIRIGP